jgi:hypothetical protein
MNLSRATLSLLLWMVVAIPGARALTVFDYSAISHERFSSGFPSSPVANASFFLSGYDRSGIGWTGGNFGVTLISPRHFVTAAHVSPGASVSFFSTDGVLRNYAVESTYTILHTAGVATDLLIGRLEDPIPGADNVSHYSTLLLGSAGDYLGLTVAAFGSGQRAGTNTIDEIGLTDMLPFGSPDSVSDNVVFVTDYDAVTGQTQGQSGDSGSPSFVAIGGSLALLGTHSAIDTESSPDRTIDVFVPSYYTAINDRLALDGYSFGAFVAIPEPSTWTVCGGLLAFAAACLRRRSRR